MKTEAEIRERLRAYELLCERAIAESELSGNSLSGLYGAARRAIVLLKWTLGETELYTL